MAIRGPTGTYSLRELFFRAHELSPAGVVSIGRSPDCVLVVTHQPAANGSRLPLPTDCRAVRGAPLMLSRSHAKLAVRDGHLQLLDCGSVNGTWVNTQQIPQHTWKVLNDGDVLTFGGPPELKQDGVLQPNPYRFKVVNLHEFLAAYTPTVRPPQQLACVDPMEPEVFRFSGPAAARLGPQQPEVQGQSGVAQAAAGSSGAAAAAAAGPAADAMHDPTQQFFRLASSLPLAEEGLPAAAQGDGSGELRAQDNLPQQQAALRLGSGQPLHPDAQGIGSSSPLLAIGGVQQEEPPAAPNAAAVPDQVVGPNVTPTSAEETCSGGGAAIAPLAGMSVEREAPGQPGCVQIDAAQRPPAVAPLQEQQQQQAGPVSQVQQQPPPQQQQPQQQEQQVPVIDLTMDDEDSPPCRPVRSPQRRRALSRSMARPAAAISAGSQEAVIILSDSLRPGRPASDDLSPSKRREESRQAEAAQHKRPKPSEVGPEGSNNPKPVGIKVEDGGERAASSCQVAVGEVEGEPPGAAASAPGAARGARAGGGETKALESIHSQFICAICQDLVVHCVATVPCGHYFCGECLAGWMANKKECPTCRTTGTSAPIWQPAIDSICNDVLEKQMSPEDLEERQHKKEAWESGRQQLEQQLKAAFEARAAARTYEGRGGGGRSGRGQQRGVDEHILGVLMGMLGGNAPAVPPEVLLGGGGFIPGLAMPNFDYGAPGGQPGYGRRGGGEPGPQLMGLPQPPPPPPLPPPPGPPHQFRVEYTRARGLSTCAACRQPLNHGSLRVGVAPPPTTRREAQNPSFGEWFHLDCVPQQYWTESRNIGVHNMRGVSAADQARIRERQQAWR